MIQNRLKVSEQSTKTKQNENKKKISQNRISTGIQLKGKQFQSHKYKIQKAQKPIDFTEMKKKNVTNEQLFPII